MFVLSPPILVSIFEMLVLNAYEKHIDCFNRLEANDCEMFAYENCMSFENEPFIQMYCILL